MRKKMYAVVERACDGHQIDEVYFLEDEESKSKAGMPCELFFDEEVAKERAIALSNRKAECIFSAGNALAYLCYLGLDEGRLSTDRDFAVKALLTEREFYYVTELPVYRTPPMEG